MHEDCSYHHRRVSPENKISEGRRFFDSDPNRDVLWLKAVGNLPDKIFVKNDIYGIDEVDGIDAKQLGEKIASLPPRLLQVHLPVGIAPI